ncbi:hypothetical protein SY88_06345 [Clostridiales bacterium PH28_bin88]|nr:hypothetical protein SY88_06345 [Clostridiales bacterium PH28_bin88]
MQGISPRLVSFLLKAVALGSVLLAFYLLYYLVFPAVKEITRFLVPVLSPFVLALILAALMDPVVNFFQVRAHMSRSLAVMTTLTIMMGAAATVLVLLISRLVVELVRISNLLPSSVQGISNYAWNIFNRAKEFYFTIDIPPRAMESLQELLQKMGVWLTDLTTSSLTKILEIVVFLPGVLLTLVFALMATYFFSRDKESLKRTVYGLLPNFWQERIDRIGGELGAAMVGFIRAQVVLMFITMLEALVGLFILRVEYAVTMAIVVGLVDALPVLGPGAVLGPWAVWELLNGNIRMAVALIILWTIISVVRQVLQPKVVGDIVGLHPLEALISIFAGLKIFGVIGVVVGPVLVVVIKAWWRAGMLPWPQNRG